VAIDIFTIQLPDSTTPNYSSEVALDGVEYKMNFKYSVRGECWYLSLYSLAGTLLVSNVRLVPRVELLLPFVDSSLPLGILVLLPTSYEYPNSPKITLENLSTDFELYYYPLN